MECRIVQVHAGPQTQITASFTLRRDLLLSNDDRLLQVYRTYRTIQSNWMQRIWAIMHHTFSMHPSEFCGNCQSFRRKPTVIGFSDQQQSSALTDDFGAPGNPWLCPWRLGRHRSLGFLLRPVDGDLRVELPQQRGDIGGPTAHGLTRLAGRAPGERWRCGW